MADTSWPAGKRFGELTDEQKHAAGKRAAAQLEQDATADARVAPMATVIAHPSAVLPEALALELRIERALVERRSMGYRGELAESVRELGEWIKSAGQLEQFSLPTWAGRVSSQITALLAELNRLDILDGAGE